MEKIKNFFVNCFNYLKANPVWAIVIGAGILFIIVLIIVMSSLSAKAKKAKKRIAKQEAEAQAKAEAEAKAQADAEAKRAKAEADKQATLARLAEEEKAHQEEEARAKAEEEARAKAEEEARIQAEQAEQARLAKIAEEEARAKAQAEKPKKTKTAKPKPVSETKTVTETKTEPKKTPAKEANVEEKKTARYAGKWSIVRMVTDEENAEEMFYFELLASNGEKLLSSEEYTSYEAQCAVLKRTKTISKKVISRLPFPRKAITSSNC